MDQIWRQAVKAEAASAQGHCHGAVLWDIVKMFDKIPHGLVARRAVELGCHPGIVRAALAAYRLPRLQRLQGAYSRPIVPTCGVAAGCPRAQRWAQLALLVGADEVARSHLAAALRIYVGDVAVSAEAATQQAGSEVVVSAAR